MSFRLTTRQFCDGSKDVTRRVGWADLKAGEHFSAVEKSQGLRKGEKVKYLGQCICISNQPEPLMMIMTEPYRRDQTMDRSELQREGFPNFTPKQFVDMFCKEMKCTPLNLVNRIVFKRYVA